MPKGRGSGVRRLKPRQRAARVANHLPNNHPFAVAWDEQRKRHMKGKESNDDKR